MTKKEIYNELRYIKRQVENMEVETYIHQALEAYKNNVKELENKVIEKNKNKGEKFTKTDSIKIESVRKSIMDKQKQLDKFLGLAI